MEKKKADIAVMTPSLGMRLSAEERVSLTNEKHLAVKAGKILPNTGCCVLSPSESFSPYYSATDSCF